MKLKILRNLGGGYPAYKEGEVRNVDVDLAADLLSSLLAEETDEPLTKDVEKDPPVVNSPDAPIKAAQTAHDIAQAKAGGNEEKLAAAIEEKMGDKKAAKMAPTVPGKSA